MLCVFHYSTSHSLHILKQSNGLIWNLHQFMIKPHHLVNSIYVLSTSWNCKPSIFFVVHWKHTCAHWQLLKFKLTIGLFEAIMKYLVIMIRRLQLKTKWACLSYPSHVVSRATFRSSKTLLCTVETNYNYYKNIL